MIYTPSYTKPKSKEQVKAFIEKNSFVTLISVLNSGELQISKTPFKLNEIADGWTLEGHLALNNPHLKTLKLTNVVTIIFDGAHGYISPLNYSNPRKSVPTWNYSTAIIKGTAEVIYEPDWLVSFVSNLSKDFEKDESWFSQVDKEYLVNLGRQAVGIRIIVDSIEAKFKLNQKTPKKERELLIEKISFTNPDLAKDMRNTEMWND